MIIPRFDSKQKKSEKNAIPPSYIILHPHFWSSCSAFKVQRHRPLLSQDLAGDILHRRLRGRAQALGALAFRLGIEEERGRRGRGGAAFQPWKGCFGWGRGLELANMYTNNI